MTYRISYDELPKMISVSTIYACDTTWHHVDDFIEYAAGAANGHNAKLELCPDFQRGHVWTAEQQTAYVEYRLSNGVQASLVLFNAPWWNGRMKKRCDFKDMVCVDGLQRLTAIRRYVTDDLPVFAAMPGGPFLRSEIEHGVGVHLTVRIGVNDLQTRAEVLRWYLELNAGGTVHTAEELDKVRAMLKELSK